MNIGSNLVKFAISTILRHISSNVLYIFANRLCYFLAKASLSGKLSAMSNLQRVVKSRKIHGLRTSSKHIQVTECHHSRDILSDESEFTL